MNGPARRRLRRRADPLLDRDLASVRRPPGRAVRRLRLERPRRRHHVAEVFKSTDAGASLDADRHRHQRRRQRRGLLRGTQCFYDNVVEVDPTNPNVVFVGGSFGYDLSPQSGGIFRSTNGGRSWVNLGWDLHPDFHALAFDPSNTKHVLIGNDGGVWYSAIAAGGRPPTVR